MRIILANRVFRCGILAACLFLGADPVHATNYFVRVAGSDANDGRASSRPFATIQMAATVAVAGDTVYVGGGDYSESVAFSNDGTSSLPIRYIADTSGIHTGDGGDVTVTSGAIVFDITTDNYIQLTNFRISGGSTAIKINNSTSALIKGCVIENTNGKAIDGYRSSYAVQETLIKSPNWDAVACLEGSFQLVNCLITNANGHGVYSKTLNAASSILHTTIARSNGDGINHDGGTLNVYDSILANNNGKGFQKGSGTLTHDYNVVYSNSGGNFSGTSSASNELTTNPKFVDLNDYHLQSGSSALDKGTDKGVSTDLESNSRPSGSRVDIGCFEGIGTGGGSGASEYFVRSTGNDSKSGTSPTLAFRTIKKAATVAKAGNKIWVGAGTYPDPVTVTNSGTAGQPIQFIADTMGAKTGDAGNVYIYGTGTYFVVTSKNYIWATGFKFGRDASSSSGDDGDVASEGTSTTVRWNSCIGGLLQDCEIQNGSDGLRLSAAEVIVERCNIHNTSDNGVLVEGSASDLTVRDSTIKACGRRGLYIRSGKSVFLEQCTIAECGNHGIRTENNSSSATLDVRSCKISANEDGLHIHGNSNITLENSLIVQNRDVGIQIHRDSPKVTVNHCTIAFNRTDGCKIDDGTTTFRNSIIAFNNDDGLDKNGGTVSNSYNLVYGNTDRNFAGLSAGTGTVQSDPKFVSSSDFHLQSASPAIDRGTGNLSLDFDGGSRPVGASVDLGCYEFGSSNGSGSGSSDSTEYFIRISGSDLKNGKTPQTAFRTIAKAVSVVQPGKTVWVGAGTYPESLDLKNLLATATTPIKFLADSTGTATGDAGNVIVQGGFYLQNASYLTVDGFVIQVSSSKPTWSSILAGAFASQTSNVTFQNLVVSGGYHNIAGMNSTDLSVTNCTASNATSHGQAFWQGTVAMLQNCRASSNGGSGFYVAASNVNVNSAVSTNNASRGFHFDASRGSIGNSSSTGDGLGAELVGVNNDRTSLTVSNLTVENSKQGGMILRTCTATILGGTTSLCSAGPYGAYVDNANLTLRNATIRSTQYGTQAVNASLLDLTDCNISSCSTDGVHLTASTATLSNCTISSCRNGVLGITNSTLQATGCTLNNHTAWGINHSGLGSVSGCTLSDNYQGLYLTGASNRGDVTVSNTTIQGTAREGLVAIRCTGDVTDGNNKLSQGGAYGAYLLDSEIKLDSVQIVGSQYGILAYSSTLDVPNATISGCADDGLYADNCSITLTNGTISDCNYGIRSENSSTLVATSCTLDSNAAWAIHHSGKGSVTNCLVTNNNQGLFLVGAAAMGDVTLSNTTIENTAREGLAVYRCTGDVAGGSGNLSQGGSYGAYLSESNLTMANIQITGPDYGVMSDSSTLILSDSTISDCKYDGLYTSQASTTLSNCNISRCRNGVFGENASTLVAASNTIDACTAWGITHSGYGSLTNCVVTSCNQGMYLIGASQPTDIQVINGTIQGTAQDGLIAIRCTGDVVGGPGNLSQGGNYGAYLSEANFLLTGVSITGSQRGIVALHSTVDLQNSTISATSQTGFYSESSTVKLTNSNFSACGTRGVDCQLDSTLTANSCVIESCGDWGLALAGFGTITACQLNNNVYGASLTGKSARGDIKLTNLAISGCANQGLVAVRCDGTVRGGSDTFSTGGDWGIYCDDSKLTVTNTTIRGPSNGIQSTLSDLTLRDVRIANGANAIYSDRDQNLVLERARLENCTGWGLQQLKGRSQLTNCLLTNNTNGLYYDDTIQANLWNTTVVSTGQYGLYQTAGAVDVKNTILVGNNTGIGIYRDGGVLATSHNLVYGFAAEFSGVAPDADTVTKNPRFANMAGGDYSLAMGSPAINAGVDLLGYADTDILGSPRPTKKRWEIGAYESLLEGASFRILEWNEKK